MCRKIAFISYFFISFMIFIIIFPTLPATAQDAEEKEKKPVVRNQFGLRFSGGGLADNLNSVDFFGGEGIQGPEDDIMPYPFLIINLRYGKYEGEIGLANDYYNGNEHEHNEDIFKFSIRYNHYGKNMYVYGGPVLWYFNQNHHLTKYVCDEYDYNDPRGAGGYGCQEGKIRLIELKTDRPNGKSIWFGISSGLGVEYKLLGLIWSHEIEVYFTPCKYEDFICTGGDIKFWGIHFPF